MTFIDVLLILLISLTASLTMGILFVLISRKKVIKNEIKMDKVRYSLEKEIYNLNKKIALTDSRFKDANHLLFDSIDYDPLKGTNKVVNTSAFFNRHGLVIEDLSIRKRDIFILLPFLDESIPIYNAIKKVCETENFNCSMGNDEYIDGDILPYILKKILEARIVIASIDGRNTNVFYELGIAHALGKPTILISEYSNQKEVPFDLQSKYIIYYKDLKDLGNKIVERILKLLIDEE